MRDVSERQRTPQQVAQSNLNAVLLAPQMAVDALDSSAGNFWRPGAFAQFLDEAEQKLTTLYPGTSKWTFASMPVIIIAYSGGYLPAVYSLEYGGAGGRVRGVVLLDALFGEPDKFADWVRRESSQAFFVSAYSASSKNQNLALEAKIRAAGVPVVDGLPELAAFRRRRLRGRQRGEPRRLCHFRLDRGSADRRAEPDGAVALS